MDHASLGAWIRRGREVRDLTQEALAEEVGCAVQTVRAFEHGWRRPSRSMAGRLAMALGVPPEERDAFIRLARAPLGSPAAPEAPAAPADPAAYLARLAGEAYAQLLGPRQHEWQDRLDAELEQLRAALTWALESQGEGRAGRVELALRAASAADRFWHARGHQAEGQRWLERGLDLVDREVLEVAPAAQAAALVSAGWLAKLRGDRERALALLHRCVALYRVIGDRRGLADVLDTLGDMAVFEGDGLAATWFYEEGLTLRRGLGQPGLVALSLGGLGHAAVLRGYYERAADHFLESLDILRGLDDRRSTAMVLHGLGLARLRQGALEDAGARLAEALRLFQSLGNTLDVALCLDLLGERLALRALTGGAGCDPALLDGAARLWGAAEGLMDALDFRLSPSELARRDGLVAAIRLRAGPERFEPARAAGRALAVAEAAAEGMRSGGAG